MPPNFSFTCAVSTPRSCCCIVFIFLITARALSMLGLCLDGSHGAILGRGHERAPLSNRPCWPCAAVFVLCAAKRATVNLKSGQLKTNSPRGRVPKSFRQFLWDCNQQCRVFLVLVGGFSSVCVCESKQLH